MHCQKRASKDVKLHKQLKTSNYKNISILTRDYNNSKTLKKETKVLSLVEIVVRNQTRLNNQIPLIGFVLKDIKSRKKQKLVIVKIFVYILTRDYNNSKTLKRIPKD